MTKEQMDKMTKKEMRDYLQKCKVFDPDMSFEEYQEAVRDAIYIGSGLLCGKKYCTWDYVNDLVTGQRAAIKAFYDDREDINAATCDVEFVGG